MAHYVRRDQRVRLRYPVRRRTRVFRGTETGRILREQEDGLGDTLVEVKWDNGWVCPHRPEELVEIEAGEPQSVPPPEGTGE